MNIAIVKYNAGNIYSVVNALRRLGVEPNLTDDPETLMKADKVVFPGQGEASSAMEYLRSRNLDRLIKDLTQPVLGICIGQQLLCSRSEEGDTECLGIFPMDVKRFQPVSHEDKIPQMGWNGLKIVKESPLLKYTREGDYVYFVHSYYLQAEEPIVAATTDYVVNIHAAVEKEHVFACQFHPEKSGEIGLKLLKNFATM